VPINQQSRRQKRFMWARASRGRRTLQRFKKAQVAVQNSGGVVDIGGLTAEIGAQQAHSLPSTEAEQQTNRE